MKFTSVVLALVASVSGSQLKDLLSSIKNQDKEVSLKQMRDRIEQLNTMTDYANLAPVINRELQAFETL